MADPDLGPGLGDGQPHPDRRRDRSGHLLLGPALPLEAWHNENTNGLLRQYFPKGSDLSVFPADYLDFVALKLNNQTPPHPGVANPGPWPSTSYCQNPSIHPVLRWPAETAIRFADPSRQVGEYTQVSPGGACGRPGKVRPWG